MFKKKNIDPDELSAKLATEYSEAKVGMERFHERWNDFLDMAYTKIVKDGSHRSQIRDGSIANLVLEGTYRTAAQPSTGKIVALTKHDEGKTQLVNLVWNRYCLPRMNWQYPLRIKLRLWEWYSRIYGVMPMFHGYHVDDEYVGPDCRLVDPKFVFPQPGRLTPNDCDWIMYEQFISPEALKGYMGSEGWDKANIKEVLGSHSKDTKPLVSSGQVTNSQRRRQEEDDLYKGQIKLVTKYRRGKGKAWTTFAPDYGNLIVRQIGNPFPSGQIPLKFKYCMPIIDSLWGMGDIERGESLQRAIDTSLNLGTDYLKMMLFPITMFSNDMNLSQYHMRPGAKWKLNFQTDKVESLNLSNQPMTVQPQLYQQFRGSLLAQHSTTDMVRKSADELGWTPQAIKAREERENSHDAFNREMLESATEELFRGMVEELGLRQTTEINFHIFDEEIAKITEAGYDDVLEIYDSAIEYYVDPVSRRKYDNPSETEIEQLGLKPKLRENGVANVTIRADKLLGEYSYNIDVGSSAANDETEEFERLNAVMDKLESGVAQAGIEALRASGKELDMGALLEQYVRGANLRGGDKLFKDIPESEQDEGVGGDTGDGSGLLRSARNDTEVDDSESGEDFDAGDLQSPMLQQALANYQQQGGMNG
jgi:hypothetical protein